MATPKQTARALLRANHKFSVTWRHISEHGYQDGKVIVKPGLSHATIYKFAIHKGAWLPGIEKQKLLGIYKQPHRRLKFISEMKEHELLAALRDRVPMSAPSPAILKAFRKLGWLKRVRVTS